MNIALYQIKSEQKQECARLLSRCFAQDPLFLALLPEAEMREELLPVFFECYLDMTFPYCTYYADSKEMNGVISVWEHSEHFPYLRYLLSSARGWGRFAAAVLRADPSGKTLLHIFRNRRFLSSGWESELPHEAEMHIDFFAVRPEKQGNGIGQKLMNAVLAAADEQELTVALETHNFRNVDLYRHFGFRLFTRFGEAQKVTQYCMVR